MSHTRQNAQFLLASIEGGEPDYTTYGPWEQFIKGRGAYANGGWITFDGNVTLDNGEVVEHVDQWEEFDEGSELFHVVVRFRGDLYELLINNDSWHDSGIEFSTITPVEAKQVTVTKYERVKYENQ